MNDKTCGRDLSCDLVVEHPSVSRYHARVRLADDGLVWVEDSGSGNGTFLRRCDVWKRIGKANLCISDAIRFGEQEVPLEQLTALFAGQAKVRLGDRPFPLQAGHIGASLRANLNEGGEQLQKPRRNPATGKVEDNPHV